jgi:hypothetical protein
LTIRVVGMADSLDPQTTLDDLNPTIAFFDVGTDLFEPMPAPGLVISPIAATTPPASILATSGAVTNAVGTLGATVMNVPAAASTFDVTGAGVTVGIISDSFDAQGASVLDTEEADGDLPTAANIHILSDSTTGNDEGRAMAELVHAVAPGAAIDFAAAGQTEQAFANAILSLAAAGANIIVDDVTFFDEPFFEDSNVIQAAVATVIADGVSYFTAASNEGTNFYQAAVTLVAGTLPNGNPATLEDFGATAAAYSDSNTLQDIIITAGTTLSFDLQWTQPFLTNGAGTDIGPGSAYTLALYLFNGTTLDASATTNVTGGDPVQILQFDASSSGTYELAIALISGTAPAGDTLKYIVYDSYTTAGSLVTIEDSNAGTGSGTITGHELVGAANTVGAVNASNPGTPEAYSSYGPGTVDTYGTSGVLTGTTVENKPNILAPDGISTSVSGFASFYGTSAAAPDAAAVAALMLQANPNLTPGQLTSALETTATSVSGTVDQVGTSGLVNANAAVAAVNGDVWTQAAGATWNTVTAWSQSVAPTATDPATLSNDFGSLTSSYTVAVNSTDAVADTLTIGNATTASVLPGVTVAIGSNAKLGITTGVTVTQNGTLTVAGAGTLAVGGLAELIDSTAVLTLQNDAIMTAAELEMNAGSLTIGSGASLTANGSIGVEIKVVSNSSTTYETKAYGVATGGGTLTVGNGGLLSVVGAGGVLLEGSLIINSGGMLADANSGGVAFLVLDGTLTDNGTLTEASSLMVNTSASVTIGAGGVLTATTVDIEGTGATLTVAGELTDAGALTGASTGHVTVAQGGMLSIGAGLSGAGVTLDADSQMILANTATTATVTLAAETARLQTPGATIDLTGVTFSGESLVANRGTTSLVKSGQTLLHINNLSGYKLTLGADPSGGTQITVACYRRGTRIATPTGDMPIETLRIGDPVLTASGKAQPVHWIGHRFHAAETVARERLIQPIRVHAGALGPRLPRRDLDISPHHALLLSHNGENVLVPVCRLVNGVSIRRLSDSVPVAYIHVELRNHDAILAEGQPAETFIDHDSRDTFDNAADYVALYPDEVLRAARFCAPRVEDGATLARIREQIDARAGLQPGELLGAVDHVDQTAIGGWAYDPENPDCPVLLEIVADGMVVGAVLADSYRADLAELGRAGGYCGFLFRLPGQLDAERRHIVSIRRAIDGAELRGVPVLIGCPVTADALLRSLLADVAANNADMTRFLAAQIDLLRGAHMI